MNCLDQTLLNALAVINRTGNLHDGFVNPQRTILLNLGSIGWSKYADLSAYIAGLNPLMPDYANILSRLQCVQTGLNVLVGNGSGAFGGSTCGKLLHFTNFMSGRTDFFPYQKMASLTGGIQKYSMLKGLTFVSVLGIAKGALSLDENLCKVDPDDPCAGIQKIFAAVLNPFNQFLNAVHAGISQMDDWLNKAQEYCDLINSWIDKIIATILDAINTLITTLVRAIQYGLAKLLESLIKDPCLSHVMKTVMSGELQEALGLHVELPGAHLETPFDYLGENA